MRGDSSSSKESIDSHSPGLQGNFYMHIKAMQAEKTTSMFSVGLQSESLKYSLPGPQDLVCDGALPYRAVSSTRDLLISWCLMIHWSLKGRPVGLHN